VRASRTLASVLTPQQRDKRRTPGLTPRWQPLILQPAKRSHVAIFFGQRRCPQARAPFGKERCSEKSKSTTLNALVTLRDQWALATPMAASPDCATAFMLASGVHTRLARCHHTSSCASTSQGLSPSRRENRRPLAREMLLRHALEWMRDGLAASKQSKLCAVCGRKAAPGSA
jgi:hypothetical protein